MMGIHPALKCFNKRKCRFLTPCFYVCKRPVSISVKRGFYARKIPPRRINLRDKVRCTPETAADKTIEHDPDYFVSPKAARSQEKKMTFQYPAVSRRNLMKSVAAAGLLANFSITPLSQAVAAAMDDMETVRWTSCVVNCGSRCPLKAIVKNGQVIRIEPENTGANSTKMPLAVPHVRACLRGRSMRQRLYSPERQVPDEARGQARRKQVRAHLLGRSA